jgi:hypothetical protein
VMVEPSFQFFTWLIGGLGWGKCKILFVLFF